MRVIMFAFWGRKDNVELQVPFIRRILDENPNVEFNGWDLARNTRDSRYLRTLEGERFHILSDYATYPQGKGINKVWRHYTAGSFRDCVFVKLDDDDVFLETRAFPNFVQAAIDNPDHVISALTINNGASTRHIPALWDIFTTLNVTPDPTPYPELGPLLGVHRSPEYAEACHRWFFANWDTLINQPGELIPTEDWLSINCLAVSRRVVKRIAEQLGTHHPEVVAGRRFRTRQKVGDEGAANTLPRLIHTGMVCAHLSFGPQDSQMTPDLLTELRKQYLDISRQYL